MLVPPLLAGAVKVTVAAVFPAVAVPIVGAPGAMAFTVKVRLTVLAAFQTLSPAWSASIVQEPAVTKVRAPPEVIVHTPVVDELKLTVKLEVAVALRVGVAPKFCGPGLVNVIVWLPVGVAEPEAPDALLVPMALVAVTVKV